MFFTALKTKRSSISRKSIGDFLSEHCFQDRWYYPGKYDDDKLKAEYTDTSPYPHPGKPDPVEWEEFFDQYSFVPLMEFGNVPLEFNFYYLESPRLGIGDHLVISPPATREHLKYVRIIFEHVKHIRSGISIELNMHLLDKNTQKEYDLACDLLKPTVKTIPYEKGHEKIVHQIHLS